jgi:hypothetical protein
VTDPSLHFPLPAVFIQVATQIEVFGSRVKSVCVMNACVDELGYDDFVL